MFTSKLIDILKSFSAEELKDFERFLNSSYFNREENVIRFFQAFRKYYPDFKDTKLTKENIFAKVYPGTKFNDALIRKYISMLIKLSGEFLSFSAYWKDPVSKNEFLLRSLKERKLTKIFEHSFKLADELLDNSKYKDEFHYYHKFIAESVKNSLIETNDVIAPDKEILKETDYLIDFFLLRILHRHSVCISQTATYKIDLELKFLDETRSYVEKNWDKCNPLIKLYYSFLMIYIDIDNDKDNEQHYLNIKKIHEETAGRLSERDLHNTYVALLQYGIGEIQIGNHEYAAETMNIYKEMLARKMFYVEGIYFGSTHFINIVILGGILKEFEWTKKFIEEYYQKLDPKIKLNHYYFSLASIEFQKGEFDEALSCLSKIKYGDHLSRINIKNLTLKIYYELKSIDPFLATIDSYRQFLLKNKSITDSRREQCANFIDLLLQLLKAQEHPENTVFLRKKILETQNVMNKKWLLEKADEIMEL